MNGANDGWTVSVDITVTHLTGFRVEEEGGGLHDVCGVGTVMVGVVGVVVSLHLRQPVDHHRLADLQEVEDRERLQHLPAEV